MTESGVCVCMCFACFRPALARTRTVPDAELIALVAPSSPCWLIYKVHTSRNLFKGHSTPQRRNPFLLPKYSHILSPAPCCPAPCCPSPVPLSSAPAIFLHRLLVGREPSPEMEHPRSTWPIPGYMPGGSVLSHIPRAQAREKSMKKSTPVYSARIGTHLIQLGTNFAVEPTLMKLSSYAQRDHASPGFHALLPLTKYTTTFRRR